MNWQETLMSEQLRNNIVYHGVGTWDGLCQAQAQITGDIAFKAGVEKVVKWVEDNCIAVDIPRRSNDLYMGIQSMAWQAFKQESIKEGT